MKSLETRLYNLEQENKRLRRNMRLTQVLAFSVALLAGAALILGATQHRLFRRLHVQQIAFVDARGTPRGVIGLDGYGGIVQTFSDSQGTERIRIAVQPDDVARSEVLTYDGEARITQATFPSPGTYRPSAFPAPGFAHPEDIVIDLPLVDREMSPEPLSEIDSTALLIEAPARYRNDPFYGLDGITLYDTSMPFMHLGWSSDGTQQLFLDRHGKVRLALGNTIEDAGFCTLYDPNGQPRLELATTADGFGYQGWYDRDSQERIWIGTAPSGFATQDMKDAEGYLRIQTSTTLSGEGSQAFFDRREMLRIWTGSTRDGNAGQDFYDE